MRIGSLFSGIGGLEKGLLDAGLGPVVWQVELDPFCRAVLARHHPEAERFEDVRTVGAHNLKPCDIVCGGFPCQDISSAGKGAGLAGERSGLFFELARIVSLLQPRYVVLENVSRLVNKGLDVVLGTLAALGYDAFWDCFPAEAFGAPHQRDRFFLVAWRVSDADSQQLRLEQQRRSPRRTGGVRDEGQPESLDVGQAVADTARERLEEGSDHAENGSEHSTLRSGGALADTAPLGRSSRSELQEHVRESDAHGERGTLADGDGDGRSRVWNGSAGYHAHGFDLPKWPPGPDDMLAWGSMPIQTQPAVCELDDGFSVELARCQLRALGNACIPDCGQLLGHIIWRLEERIYAV